MDVNGQSIVVGLSKGWVKVYDTRRIGPIGRSHNSYSFANNPVSKDTGNLFKSIEVTPKKNVFCDYKDEGYLINSEIGLSPQWPEGIYQNTIWIKNRSPIRKFDTEHLLLNSPDIVSPVNRSLLSISNDEEEIIWHDQQYLFRLLTKPKSVRTLSFSQIFNNENPRIFYAMHQRQKPNFITIGYH